MRLLVTGAGGFIGAHVVRALARSGHTVFAAGRKMNTSGLQERESSEIQYLQLDVRDDPGVRTAVRQICPDVTIHLAWCKVTGRFWTAPANLDWVSTTLSVARAVADEGCRRLVLAGSCAEYDWNYGFLSEECTPLKPQTLYGACKNALREILESYALETSMQLAWLRLFYLYGPGEDRTRFIPSVILPLLHGKTAKCTSGEQMRDFLQVEDMASAISAVATSNFAGAINIGSGLPVKIRTIVETIARILECPDRLLVGGLPDNPAEPPLLVADVRKLTREIGWRPSHTLEDGLQLTVDWWRANT
ncbi:MAG: NAD(P)-dependent oxidoreductase [Candidatus Acidiferrales bacterium]